ncbi:MAG: hypothetical protein ACM3UZ_16300 [Acidobacteriota bacterium]
MLFTAENQSRPANVWITVERNPITLSLIQQEADNGHFPELLDPQAVAKDYIQNTLELGTVKRMSFQTNTTLKAELLAILKGGRQVDITLIRPIRKDEEGIWAVDKYKVRNES